MEVERKVHLRSAGAPNGVGEYQWTDNEAVVAVPESLANQLINVKHSGFTVAEPYVALPKPKTPAQPPAPPGTTPSTLVEQLVPDAAPEPQTPVPLQEGLDLVQPKGTRGKKG